MRKILILLALFASITSCTQVNKSTPKTTNMKTIELTKAEFLEKVADIEANPKAWKFRGDKPVVIDFYASWCGPCKMIAPILEELAAEYDDRIVIYKVNVDDEPELATAFDIRTVPSLLFVPMSGEPQMTRGVMSKSDIKKSISKILLNE